VKRNKFYYHDRENDLIEYREGSKESEEAFAVWVNPHLTLMFPFNCKELIPSNIVGFQLNEIEYVLRKAEEQAKEPLTIEQKQRLEDFLKDWKENGHTTETSTSAKQAMDANTRNPCD
jgi:hypothetical protein